MYQLSVARLLVWAVVLAVILPTAATARARTVDDPDLVLGVAGLEVAVWSPAGGSQPYPLVLFSHGFRGCNTQSTYLMRALAEHGMLVVAPDHEDRDRDCPDKAPTFTADDVARIVLSPHQDRADDLNKLRAALSGDPTLSRWPIDPDRVVLIGHSLGGYTVLGLSGARPSWQMKGIAAVVALAPFAQPFLSDGAADKISVPVLLQSGDEDYYTPAVNQDVIFAKLPSPACKVVYAGANHFAWTKLETTEFHDATAAATIAFLDAVFAGGPLNEAILASSRTDHGEKCK